ncbi:MAG: HYR domain-containing protein [Saprospiraceae bacterium]|nr:HYR domain-containing protein [Saprospiraceae bacterium]
MEFAIQVKATLTLSALVVNEGCEGVANGAINLAVTPSSSIDPGLYSFIWSNGATTQNINNLSTGNYSVTVTHPDACMQTASFFVNAKPNPDPVLIVSGNSQYIIPQCQSTGLILFQGTVIACDIEAATDPTVIANRLSVSGVAGLSVSPTYVDTENGFAYFEFAGNVAPGLYLADVTYDDGVRSVTVDVVLQVLSQPDSQNPVITDCPAGISVDNDPDLCFAEITLTAPSFTDNCPLSDISVTYGVINPDNTYNGPNSPAVPYNFSTGHSLVIWTVTDLAGNFSTCIQNIDVNDIEEPSIICPAGSPFSRNNNTGACGYTAENGEFDAVASDNCNIISLTHNYGNWGIPGSLAGASFPVGSTMVVWTATDAAGNTASCAVMINVEDIQEPVFINCPNTTFTIGTDADCNNGVIWSIPIAQDNCTGVSVMQTGGPALGSQLTPGTYNIQYTATDANANSASCNFTIIIEDDSTPLLVCQPNITVNTNTGVCTWTAQAGDLNPLLAVDNCPDYELTYQISGGASGSGPVPTGTVFNVGTSTVSYT